MSRPLVYGSQAVRESFEGLGCYIRGEVRPDLEPARDRYLEGRLSAEELARVYHVEWDRLNRAAELAAAPDANPAALRELLLQALGLEGPGPEAPFADRELQEAAALLERERRAREILGAAGIVSAAELQDREFPPPRWAIPGLLAEGLGLLSAPPKAGKSWLALGLLRAVASGGLALGRIACPRGRALYVSLEDSERRLQKRLEVMGGQFPEGLDIARGIPAGATLPEFLEAWLDVNPSARLVVVDTLGRALRCDLNDYDTVTGFLGPLQRLALDRGVAILLVHHVKKGGADGDPFDQSLGSQAVLGAMDTAVILERKRGEDAAVLRITGRDVPDAEFALELRTATMEWQLLDSPPEEVRAGPERREILRVLRSEARPMRTGEIAKRIGRVSSTASEHLHALLDLGAVRKGSAFGSWEIVRKPTESTESPKAGPAYRDGYPSNPTETPESPKVSLTEAETTFGDSVLSVTFQAPKAAEPVPDRIPRRRPKTGEVEGATWADLGLEDSEP